MTAIVFAMGFLFAVLGTLVMGGSIHTAIQGGILSAPIAAILIYWMAEPEALPLGESRGEERQLHELQRKEGL